MLFDQWLIAKAGEDSAIGDLASDVKQDPDWPPLAGFYEQKAYLESHDACDGAIDQLRRAHDEYREYLYLESKYDGSCS
jgi:hypothetical protein